MDKPTIREVAKLAGVAVGTVSNVLNDSATVRDTTREKVEIAMRQLGFRPDAIARSLIARRGRAGTVKPVPGRPRLSSIGYVSVDYTARIDRFPDNGDRITSQGIKKSLGGPAANVAVMAAGLGGRCALNCELITALGPDPDSEWALSELAERGVRAVTIHPYRAGRLSRCIVLVDETGARTIINEPFELALDDLTRYVGRFSAGEAHCLHIEGYQVPAVVGLLGAMDPRGILTSVHATGLPAAWHSQDGLSRLLDHFDVVFLNRDSAAAMLGGGLGSAEVVVGMEREFRRLAPLRRARLMVVTLGAEGAFICPSACAAEHIPANPVTVVDTTGAGDTFVGCFLAAWLNGDDPIAAGRLATAAGSLAVAVEGAQGARITMDMLASYGIATERSPGDAIAAQAAG
ncbi:MAG: PfkB family carbohydrate kinase [Inquilinaceae bacterium]